MSIDGATSQPPGRHVGPVAITGSSGHIGAALAALLHRRGIAVVGLDRRPGPWTAVEGDLSTMALEPALAGCAVVVHCAALHAPHVGSVDEEFFVRANVATTGRLLAAAERVDVGRFVFTSTTSVYGHALEHERQAVWVDEELPPRPRDIYDVTKLDAEAMVADRWSTDLTTVTLRIARCFPEPWHTTVTNRLHRGVDLRDVVQAIELALAVDLDRHEVLNIAGPRLFERADLVRLRSDAAAVTATRLPWLPAVFAARGWPLPRSIDRVYVSDRAATVLGYRPRHGVASALAEAPAVQADRPLPTAC